MSYGVEGFPTKASLRRAVLEDPAQVYAFGTSLFGDELSGSVAEILQKRESILIVGPDVYRKRSWYANVTRDRSGRIVVK